MATRTVIPFGPQHPVLPEPVHLDLVVEGEKVVQAIPSIGFVHRGLEKLVEKKDFTEYVFVAERICGICSFIHGMTYCHGVEQIMGIEVPRRAQYLRVIWSELSRIHSHLLWLGLAADSFGFENLFMASWRIREHVLNIIEATTGNRVIFSSCRVGGVARDIDDATLKDIVARLEGLATDLRNLGEVFLDDTTVKHRTVGVGVLTKEHARELGAVGPTLRGSGVASDMRQLKYAAYGDLAFEPLVEDGCDCHARCKVRVREIGQSIDLIRQAAARIPAGEIAVKVKGTPSGEFFARTEQPRGEVVYYLRANGTRNLDRLRVRTPTFANLPPLVKMLENCDLADVPVIVLTIDPCISCTER
jgi:ech hydrogenase subunit E